jgi:hypothetical protein
MPTYRRLASLPALLLSSVLFAACATAPTPAPSSAPPSIEPPSPSGPTTSPDASPAVVVDESADGIWVGIQTLGGHCVQGSCDSTVVIEMDGRVHQVAPEEKELGTVPREILDALAVEVQQADFDAIRSRPFTDTCPIAFDGQQFVYSFWIVTHEERIDSCETVVDPANPLFVAVNAALASVASN